MFELWQGRLGTLQALAALSLARIVVRWTPFYRWRDGLGWNSDEMLSPSSQAEARRIATLVERAATRSNDTSKCLPRAGAVRGVLRRKHIPHTLVVAARPERLRGGPDALHAWIEVGGAKIIGDLPGPWIETLRLGA